MKLFSKILIASAMLFASAGLLYDALGNNAADAAGVDYSRDCDKYAVMYCGSMTKAEIIQKLNNGDGRNSAADIQNIYAQFGLNASIINNANFVNGIVYQNGEVRVDNRVVATNSQTYIRHLGGKGPTSRMGSAQAALVAMDANGKFMFAVMTPCGNPVTGVPVEPPKPVQALACDVLKVDIINKEKREVKATLVGSATNTTVQGYRIHWGDGTAIDKNTGTHTFSNYGKFTIKGVVAGMYNGVWTPVTSPACEKVVEFKEPPKPQEQSITCDALNLDLFNKDKRYVKVSVVGTAQNTKIDDYKIDFGDGTVVNKQTAEHTYADFGKYTIKVYVSGKVKEQVVTVGGSGNCAQTVEFKENIEPCPTDPTLPIDDPRCVEHELPNTGAGAMVGLFSGVSILGAISHRLWLNRKIGL